MQDVRLQGTPPDDAPSAGEAFLAGVLAHLQELLLYWCVSPASKPRLDDLSKHTPPYRCALHASSAALPMQTGSTLS